MSEPKLIEAQMAALLNWATQRSRPGLGGTLDELRELVAGWLAEARAEALRDAADALYTFDHLPEDGWQRWRWRLNRTGLADNQRVAEWLRERAARSTP